MASEHKNLGLLSNVVKRNMQTDPMSGNPFINWVAVLAASVVLALGAVGNWTLPPLASKFPVSA